MSLVQLIARDLREQLDEANETIRQLREMLVPDVRLPGLTAMEQRIVSVLVMKAPSLATYESIQAAMYDGREDHPGNIQIPGHIVRIRRKLSQDNITIKLHYREGYSMTAEDSNCLKQKLGQASKEPKSITWKCNQCKTSK